MNKMNKNENRNTKTHPKRPITQWLQTDLWRAAEVSTAIQLELQTLLRAHSSHSTQKLCTPIIQSVSTSYGIRHFVLPFSSCLCAIAALYCSHQTCTFWRIVSMLSSCCRSSAFSSADILVHNYQNFSIQGLFKTSVDTINRRQPQ